MSRPRSFLTALALTVAVLAGTACSVTDPAAFRAGDRTLSRAQLVSELNALADNPTAVSALFNVTYVPGQPPPTQGDVPGTFNTGFTAAVLQRHLLADALEIVAEGRGLEISEEDLVEAEAQLAMEVPGELGGFGSVMARAFVAQNALVADLAPGGFDELDQLAAQEAQQELQELYFGALEELSVWVDGRFGRWDAERLLLVPPEGPQMPAVDEQDLLAQLLESGAVR